MSEKNEVELTAEEQFSKEQKELFQAYGKVFNTVEGKRVMAHLEQQFFFDRTTNTTGDPLIMAGNEGMRGALLFIKDMIKTAIEGPTSVSEAVMEKPETKKKGE